jgi:predicted kinase
MHDRGWLDTEADGELMFVLATGNAETRATFTAELARRLHAAHLDVDVVDRALRESLAEGRRTAVARVVAGLADGHLRAGISIVIDAALDLELEAELNRVRRSHPDVPVVRVQALEGQTLMPDRLVGEVIARANRRRG